jgi:hypothetical protein
MGCDGQTPNVICPSRINSIVKPWLAALPNPSSGGPLNNYLAPAIPDTILGNSDYYMGRVDVQFGSNDHMFASFWHHERHRSSHRHCHSRFPTTRIPIRRTPG